MNRLPDAEAPTVTIARITDDYPGRHRADEKPWAGITVDVVVAAAFRRVDRRNGYPTHSRSVT